MHTVEAMENPIETVEIKVQEVVRYGQYPYFLPKPVNSSFANFVFRQGFSSSPFLNKEQFEKFIKCGKLECLVKNLPATVMKENRLGLHEDDSSESLD